MTDEAAIIAVSPSIILASVAVVYGGMAAAIGYLWRGQQDQSIFIRENLMQISGGAMHREKVYFWFLSRQDPQLIQQAEEEIGDLEESHNKTASLPVAKPQAGHGSKRRPGHKSGEHRMAMTLVGLVQTVSLVAMVVAMAFLLASCMGLA